MARPSPYLTLRAAADLMNVSQRYVEKLIDLGKFEGVERGLSGQVRLPRAEVERVSAAMKATSREALDSLNEATSDARAMEDAAAGPARRRWVKRP